MRIKNLKLLPTRRPLPNLTQKKLQPNIYRPATLINSLSNPLRLHNHYGRPKPCTVLPHMPNSLYPPIANNCYLYTLFRPSFLKIFQISVPFPSLKITCIIYTVLILLEDQSYEPWFSKKVSVFAGKKYKPVTLKTKPVLATLPDKFRIIRNIRADPLADIPTLSPTPPPFIPTECYTQERKEYIDSIHNDGFLWPEEIKLMHHFMTVQEKAFTWEDSERGSFRRDFFPPIDIPVIEHTPWVL